jgi:hypothetical protein
VPLTLRGFAIALLLLVAGCGAPPPTETPRRPITDLAKLRASLLARAGITVEARDGGRTVAESVRCREPDGQPCTRCELAGEGDERFPELVAGVTRAFARYPTHVLKVANLRRVLLCRTLRGPRGDTKPAGTTFLAEHVLAISLEHAIGDRGEEPTEGIVHHELFHLIDWETAPETFEDDPAWSELNPAGFAYGPDQELRRGFVDEYAMTTVAEDRASVFEYMVGAPELACLLAEYDPILAAKIKLLATRLAPKIEIAFLEARAPCATAAPPAPHAETGA